MVAVCELYVGSNAFQLPISSKKARNALNSRYSYELCQFARSPFAILRARSIDGIKVAYLYIPSRPAVLTTRPTSMYV
jgi:hypothetical protein